MKRKNNRAYDQIRPLRIVPDFTEHPDGSILLELGKTKVICTVTLDNNIPLFVRNKKKWWLTASYALLPASTQMRSERESITKRNDRSAEISRLIGRSLRSVLQLHDKTEEKTIHVDCDVIQADGGTRTACVTGAFIALKLAQQRWLATGLIAEPIIMDDIAAISVGLRSGKLLLDIDFSEDSSVEADFNFVLTRSGSVIEIQGSAERNPIAWEYVERMKDLAYSGVNQIFSIIEQEILLIPSSNLELTRDQTL